MVGRMRAVVQRATEARVLVAGEVVGAIGPGLCAFVGVTHSDTADSARSLASKLWDLRVFNDADGVMNLAAKDVGAEVLVISQFTLYGDTSRGRRPSWQAAAPGGQAEPLIRLLTAELARLGASVATGRFGARMQVHLVNDGPVTLILDI
jgi:D-tyrosyl-tRNA(Tyr) deacylase